MLDHRLAHAPQARSKRAGGSFPEQQFRLRANAFLLPGRPRASPRSLARRAPRRLWVRCAQNWQAHWQVEPQPPDGPVPRGRRRLVSMPARLRQRAPGAQAPLRAPVQAPLRAQAPAPLRAPAGETWTLHSPVSKPAAVSAAVLNAGSARSAAHVAAGRAEPTGRARCTKAFGGNIRPNRRQWKTSPPECQDSARTCKAVPGCPHIGTIGWDRTPNRGYPRTSRHTSSNHPGSPSPATAHR